MKRLTDEKKIETVDKINHVHGMDRIRIKKILKKLPEKVKKWKQ